MKQTPIVELDHFGVNVRSMPKARAFYEAALGAIGMKINMDFGSAFGMGSKSQVVFWVVEKPGKPSPLHYAFRVLNREEVDAFYEAALEAGGTDNGAPGLRPNYGPDYYATFVHDPEGNNVEVVCYAKGPPPKPSRAAKATKGATRGVKSANKAATKAAKKIARANGAATEDDGMSPRTKAGPKKGAAKAKKAAPKKARGRSA